MTKRLQQLVICLNVGIIVEQHSYPYKQQVMGSKRFSVTSVKFFHISDEWHLRAVKSWRFGYPLKSRFFSVLGEIIFPIKVVVFLHKRAREIFDECIFLVIAISYIEGSYIHPADGVLNINVLKITK